MRGKILSWSRITACLAPMASRYAAAKDDALQPMHVVDATAIRECAALKTPAP
jgi:hypothetical protein